MSRAHNDLAFGLGLRSSHNGHLALKGHVCRVDTINLLSPKPEQTIVLTPQFKTFLHNLSFSIQQSKLTCYVFHNILKVNFSLSWEEQSAKSRWKIK